MSPTGQPTHGVQFAVEATANDGHHLPRRVLLDLRTVNQQPVENVHMVATVQTMWGSYKAPRPRGSV